MLGRGRSDVLLLIRVGVLWTSRRAEWLYVVKSRAGFPSPKGRFPAIQNVVSRLYDPVDAEAVTFEVRFVLSKIDPLARLARPSRDGFSSA